MPYLDPALTGQRLLVGANFASAGIGILNDTGIQFVSSYRTSVSNFQFFPPSSLFKFLADNFVTFLLVTTAKYCLCTNQQILFLILQANIIRIPLQLSYFSQYQARLSALIGAQQAKQLVGQALVLITLGGNDFVNNYYLVPNSARSRQYSLPDYVRYLISEYQKILAVIISLFESLLHLQFQALFGCPTL